MLFAPPVEWPTVPGVEVLVDAGLETVEEEGGVTTVERVVGAGAEPGRHCEYPGVEISSW